MKKKIIVLATLLWKLQAVKDLVRPLPKNQRVRTPFDSEHVNGSQTLVKSAWEHFHHFFRSLSENLTWKISPLGICWIWGMFRYTLTANQNYSFQDLENLCSPTQIQLSLKPTTFSQNFWIFWNLYQFLNILEKMMIIIGRLFRKLQTVRDLVRPLSKKHRFRTPLDSQHVKGFQTLIKSAWQHFHHIFNQSERTWLEKYLT